MAKIRRPPPTSADSNYIKPAGFLHTWRDQHFRHSCYESITLYARTEDLPAEGKGYPLRATVGAFRRPGPYLDYQTPAHTSELLRAEQYDRQRDEGLIVIWTFGSRIHLN